ncbi:MAG: hypothetical protein FWC36_09240 [Spirochaetes bacterium]|nr:hypothetical protein [Spirochaetota bacterium]
MKIRYIFLIFIFFVMFSCNESDMGIFHGLSVEERIPDGTLPRNLTIGSMLRAGTNLYIAAGDVWRKAGAADWERIPSPLGGGFHLSTSMATDGTDIFAVYFHRNTAETALFRLDAGDIWTEINIVSAVEGSIQEVKSANNTIFVSRRVSANEGRLYYLNGAAFNHINIPMVGSSFNVIHDGTDFWISNRNRIFSGAAPGTVSDAHSLHGRNTIRGLAAHGGNIFFTYWDGSRRSYIRYITSAGSPGTYSTSQIFMLNNIRFINISGYYFLLCGTGGRGYFQSEQQFNPSPEHLIRINRPRGNTLVARNYSSAVELHTAAILDFFIDGTGPGGSPMPDDTFYALTATRGLWRNFDTGGGREWRRE